MIEGTNYIKYVTICNPTKSALLTHLGDLLPMLTLTKKQHKSTNEAYLSFELRIQHNVFCSEHP